MEEIGVCIREHNHNPNTMQLSEADRVDKYNDLKALEMLLCN